MLIWSPGRWQPELHDDADLAGGAGRWRRHPPCALGCPSDLQQHDSISAMLPVTSMKIPRVWGAQTWKHFPALRQYLRCLSAPWTGRSPLGRRLQQADPSHIHATIPDSSVPLGQRGVLTSLCPMHCRSACSLHPHRAGNGGTCSGDPWPGTACAVSPTACGSTCPAAVHTSLSWSWLCSTQRAGILCCCRSVLLPQPIAPAPGLPNVVAAPRPIVRLHRRHRLSAKKSGHAGQAAAGERHSTTYSIALTAAHCLCYT